MNKVQNTSQTTLSRVLSHLAFWVAYILFFFFQYRFFQENFDPTPALGSLSITAIIDIVAAYFTVYFLLPKFLFKRRYLWFAVLFTVSAAVAIIMQRALMHYITVPLFYPEMAVKYGSFWHINPFYSFFNIYTVVSLFATIKLMKYWYKNQQLRNELENKNKASELALLKTQINPHFLFNTLNNIDTLISTDQEKASDAVIKLSDIMRFVLYEAKSDSIALEKEIEYLENYISLQQLRLKNPFFVSFEKDTNCNHKTIAPMLFIPFVENAFKHGQKNVVAPGIEITLDCKEGNINFEVVNRCDKSVIQNKDTASGIGLENVKKRLQLLYPNRHKLEIDDRNGLFKVKLSLVIGG